MAKSRVRAGRKLRSSRSVSPDIQRFQEFLNSLSSLSQICSLPRNHNHNSLFSMALRQLEEYAQMLLLKEEFWQRCGRNREAEKIRQDLERLVAKAK